MRLDRQVVLLLKPLAIPKPEPHRVADAACASHVDLGNPDVSNGPPERAIGVKAVGLAAPERAGSEDITAAFDTPEMHQRLSVSDPVRARPSGGGRRPPTMQ